MEATRHFGRGDQDGILVERAVAHSLHGEGVPRVVFVEYEATSRPEYPAYFVQECDMLFGGNVVEHAGSEDEIEGRTDKVKGLVLRTEFLRKS